MLAECEACAERIIRGCDLLVCAGCPRIARAFDERWGAHQQVWDDWCDLVARAERLER